MRKAYKDVCPLTVFSKAHTVQTFKGEIFINAWDGDFISRQRPTTRVHLQKMYRLAKNMEIDGYILADRQSRKKALRLLSSPIPIRKQF